MINCQISKVFYSIYINLFKITKKNYFFYWTSFMIIKLQLTKFIPLFLNPRVVIRMHLYTKYYYFYLFVYLFIYYLHWYLNFESCFKSYKRFQYRYLFYPFRVKSFKQSDENQIFIFRYHTRTLIFLWRCLFQYFFFYFFFIAHMYESIT